MNTKTGKPLKWEILCHHSTYFVINSPPFHTLYHLVREIVAEYLWISHQHTNLQTSSEIESRDVAMLKRLILTNLSSYSVFEYVGVGCHEIMLVSWCFCHLGGIFSGQLECENTKLLIITNPTGEKYKYACAWKLPCVLPSWVHESVREGYAVSVEPHLLAHKEVVTCSTPNHDETREYITGNTYA